MIEQYPWLQFMDTQKLVYSVCPCLEKKICSVQNVSVTVITESINYRPPGIKDHDYSLYHQQALRVEEQEWIMPQEITSLPQKKML